MERAQSFEPGVIEQRTKYQLEFIDRVSKMMSLVRSDVTAAQAQLEEYKDNSLRDLGLL